MKVFNSVHDFDYSWDEVSTANWRKYCPWNQYSSHVIAVDTLSREFNRETGVLRTERLITCKQGAPKWISSFLGGSEVSHVYEVSYITPPAPPSPESTTAAQNTTKPSSILAQVSTKSSSKSTKSPSSTSSTSSSTKSVLAPTLAYDPLDKPKLPNSRVPTISMTSVNLTWSDMLRVHERVTYTPSPLDPTHKTRFEQHASVVAFCGGWQKIREKIEGFTVERFGQNAERGRKGFEAVLKMGREKGFLAEV